MGLMSGGQAMQTSFFRIGIDHALVIATGVITTGLSANDNPAHR